MTSVSVSPGGPAAHVRLAWPRSSLLPRATPAGAGHGSGRRAPRPAPRRIAAGLDAVLCDGTPLPAATHVCAAARAFATGNGFIPGQVVDCAI